MEIQKILRYRSYLVLALVYVISVTALCFKAPVVQRPVELTSADVETRAKSIRRHVRHHYAD